MHFACVMYLCYVRLVPHPPERAFDSLELEFQAEVRNPVCLVGNELGTELAKVLRKSSQCLMAEPSLQFRIFEGVTWEQETFKECFGSIWWQG